MTERDAFLQAIIEAPHDDTPRLIFADWLDEHGEADRAELVRLQCRLAKMANSDAELQGREAELLKRADAWMESISFDRGRVTFRRGFVEAVTCSCFTLHTLGDAFALHPIVEVKLDEADESCRREAGQTAEQFRQRLEQEAGRIVAAMLATAEEGAATALQEGTSEFTLAVANGYQRSLEAVANSWQDMASTLRPPRQKK
jgi:uncharacterized protein (TIGR02996 family)